MIKFEPASYKVMVNYCHLATIEQSVHLDSECNWKLIDRRTNQSVWWENSKGNIFTLKDAKALAKRKYHGKQST